MQAFQLNLSMFPLLVLYTANGYPSLSVSSIRSLRKQEQSTRRRSDSVLPDTSGCGSIAAVLLANFVALILEIF